MNPAPFSPETVPTTCVYSAQGNLVCQKTQSSDPIIPMTPYSCSAKRPVVEKYDNWDLKQMKQSMMGALNMSKTQPQQPKKELFTNTNDFPPYDNISTAMNMNYAVSPWPF